MASASETSVFRSAIIQELQARARRGQPVEEMVSFVQQELGHPQLMIIPVLAYFCQAFSFPLPEVLPLREWVTTHDDRGMELLLAHLRPWAYPEPSPAEKIA